MKNKDAVSTRNRNCRTCKHSRTRRLGAKYCSRTCFYKSIKGVVPKNIKSGVLWTPELNERRRIAELGEKGHNWKGDNVGYFGLHAWLRREYTKKERCEFCKEKGKTQWALKRGKNYERKRENYKELCSKCHVNYDNITNRGWKTKGTIRRRYTTSSRRVVASC